MNRSRFVPVAVGAFLSVSAAIFAEEAAVERARVVPKGVTCTTSYSVEVPVLARVQGSVRDRKSVV